ncbi:MAG TPA: BlaI/MecI/CopY family transcriptional regulator [Bryobacteraceae bacterium]|nr:BlaI/MecI/CopY family transcriptional regulator [Bryobacteraceae bacterium]
MDPLSKRERLIMDVLYRLGSATAADVHAQLPGDVSYSTVRTQLRILEEKGKVTHVEEGTRYRYSPCVARENAGRSALRHLLDTFFEGSAERMMATLLTSPEQKPLPPEELDRLARLIRDARKSERKS